MNYLYNMAYHAVSFRSLKCGKEHHHTQVQCHSQEHRLLEFESWLTSF